jgi:hypothetical protein
VLRHKTAVEINKDRIADTWETTRDAVAPRIAAAREVLTPYVDTAAARVSPVLEEARGRLRKDVVPAVIAAAETAKESSAPARAEAKDRAAAALLALRGDRPQKTRRWPTAVACLLAGAAAGVAASIIRRPQPAPTGVATPFPQQADRDATAPTGAGGSASPSSAPGPG